MSDKKYIALYKSIKDKITGGEYKSGQKLPSKRVMSGMCGYSLITVENAYRMLADEGYVKPVEKSGYFRAGVLTADVQAGMGQFADTIVYQLLASEWRARKEG